MGATHILAAGNFGSPLQLLILLVIILLLFGGNRLRSLGSDIGGAIKGFKNSMAEAEKDKPKSDDGKVIEGKVVDSDKDQHKPS